MYSDLSLTTTTVGSGGPSWAGEFPADVAPITLDADLVLATYTDGVIPSGAVLAKVTATGRHAPYGGSSDEVQTLTEGGSGLTSFTITYAGQTTTSLDDDATAAEVQAALLALSNLAPGDVVVTGGPLASGPFTLTFGGTLANTNVAAVTTTPTGGTGTVVVATTTAGGADAGTGGTEIARGHLLNDRIVRAGKHVDAALYYRGRVYEDLLPANSGFDELARVELAANIYYDKVGA